MKHSWQQRRKWRDAKRRSRARIHARANHQPLRVFLAGKEISNYIHQFTMDSVNGSIEFDVNRFESQALAGFTVTHVEITMFDDRNKLYNWIRDLFQKQVPINLKLIHGDKWFRAKVYLKSLSGTTSYDCISKLYISLQVTGKLKQGKP